MKNQRNREIARKYRVEEKSVKDLAVSYGVSQRTIQRVLRGYLAGQCSCKSGKRQRREVNDG